MIPFIRVISVTAAVLGFGLVCTGTTRLQAILGLVLIAGAVAEIIWETVRNDNK